MNTTFFFEIQRITDNALFDELNEQELSFSYFLVDQKYYLFFYSQKSVGIDFLFQSIDVIQELDSKKRKLRSLRGFFLYALEIMQAGKDVQVLTTNLQPFFWKKVANTIRQNKKGALQKFLFNTSIVTKHKIVGSSLDLENQIQTLQNQVNSLQQKVIQLTAKLMRVEQNSKYPLSEPSQLLKSSKTIQQGGYTLEVKKTPYLPENDQIIHSEIKEPDNLESIVFSEASKSTLTTLSKNRQYNLSSNQDKGLNRSNFITLGKISDEKKIEIIQKGFQLQAEGKISFKKYYESRDQYSLFQFKGYQIKYESIRRTKLYQQLKF